MGEAFLQYVWKHRLFLNDELKTTDGQQVKVIHPGQMNRDAGPDFFNARIMLNETLWAGNIEIHTQASDWLRHGHETNPTYNNVILHVVQKNDREIRNEKGELVPALELRYPSYLELNYQSLLQSDHWIACAENFHEVDFKVLQIGFYALMVERLQEKTQTITHRLQQNKNDWNETFYQFLAHNFGMKINAVPFELLAQTLPLQVLTKHKNNLIQLEALLYGTAGLLNKQVDPDEYFSALQKEYAFLLKKYQLKPIETHLWKFLRLRPVNFPTIRIGQFAALIHQSSALFSRLTELERLEDIRSLFQIQASPYWDTHYRFNKESTKRYKRLGEATFQNLIINTVIPFLFVFGEYHNLQDLKDRALTFLEQIPAETNSIVSKWKKLGVKANSALDSQALIQLKNCYCKPKKCLNCQVGVKLIRRS